MLWRGCQRFNMTDRDNVCVLACVWFSCLFIAHGASFVFLQEVTTTTFGLRSRDNMTVLVAVDGICCRRTLVAGTAEVQSLWFSHPYISAVSECSCRPDKLTPTMTTTVILFTFLRPKCWITEQLYCVNTMLDTNEHNSKTVESYKMQTIQKTETEKHLPA